MPDYSNSCRILFDLQACQSKDSARRGVGNYSEFLFEYLSLEDHECDLHAFQNPNLPHKINFGKAQNYRLHDLPLLPSWDTASDYNGGYRDTLNSGMSSSVFSQYNYDVLHVSHLFESSPEILTPNPLYKAAGQVFSATLYDLIPLVFQHHYFNIPGFEKWYRYRLQFLQSADLLLSISESSRQDAIKILGIEPHRIVTIHGGISDDFRPLENTKAVKNELNSRYKIHTPKTVVYAGGDDFRKNLLGAIDAFSSLDVDTLKSATLIIICNMSEERKQFFADYASKAGVPPGHIVMTGYIPQNDLVGFYTTCDVMFYPSIYEGLGLPILEAMACGAPVIGGNNSSISELIVRKDALFNASDKYDSAKCLEKALNNSDFSGKLIEHGQKRAKEFTWEKSAKLSVEAMHEALLRIKHSGIKAASNGWLPPKKLAILTPLPPDKSGIADYSAEIIPYLAKYFDIDLYVDREDVSDETLKAQFPIFHQRDFLLNAENYDAILYEVGNSEFHAHMLEYMKAYPGVVGLHDAYLSGLYGWLDFNNGHNGSYQHSLLKAHGTRARHYYAPIQEDIEPNGHSIVALPMIKSVLQGNLGIISHSSFNLEIAKYFHPESWDAPFKVIPQLVSPNEPAGENEKTSLRERFGFKHTDFILGTFGHIAWNKCGDLLLAAFLNSKFAKDKNCYLIYVGQLSDDQFGKDLLAKIENTGVQERIKITGFVDGDDYQAYLKITDMAVQLRIHSRGGTPRGVLDCMAHETPVLINNAASYRDYPDDVVIKIAAQPTVGELTEKLNLIYSDRDRLSSYCDRAQSYLKSNHTPSSCAATYASAIFEFYERKKNKSTEVLLERILPAVATLPSPEIVLNDIQVVIEPYIKQNYARPTFHIDVGHITKFDFKSGIQRVVKEIVSEAYCRNESGLDINAFNPTGKSVDTAVDWLDSLGVLMHDEKVSAAQKKHLLPNDHLLMLDYTVGRMNELADLFEDARSKKVEITTTVYDILPITLPLGHIVDGGREFFEESFIQTVKMSDNLICISRAVADDVITYIKEKGISRSGLKVGWWHLGSSPPKLIGGNESPSIKALAQSQFALMVSTIEPRKNYSLALDSFELLWEKGIDCNLVIVGQNGWLSDNLIERLESHPEKGKRLHYLGQVEDIDLQSLFKAAKFLFFISKAEGFGLPVVEAAHFGTPVVCSDIPVFREFADGYANFVDINKGKIILANQLKDIIQNDLFVSNENMPLMTWNDSMEQLLSRILEKNWYYSF